MLFVILYVNLILVFFISDHDNPQVAKTVEFFYLELRVFVICYDESLWVYIWLEF